MACRLLERQKLDNGNAWPETIAVVLWGTDNIKTYGESLAQVSAASTPLCFFSGSLLVQLCLDQGNMCPDKAWM